MIYHPAEIDTETGLFIREQGIYIAGKPSLRATQIQQMYKDFELMGHRITYRWADAEVEVKIPYRENPEINLPSAERMLQASAMADVFIFFQDENIHGALEERGAFSVKALENPLGKKLYVVEDKAERQSIFDTLEFAEVLGSTQKIYQDLGRIASLMA